MPQDDDAMDEHAARAFKRVFATLGALVERSERHAQLPAWSLFGADKRGSQRKIDALLEEALATLSVARLTELRAAYQALEDRERALYAQRDDDRRRALTAPDQRRLLPSRTGYERRVGEADAALAAIAQEKEHHLDELSDEFRRIGLQASADQVRAFLIAATGDSMIELNAAFHNVRQITQQLAVLNREGGEQAATSKRYYGMYMVMTRVLLHAYDRFLGDIAARYVPALEAIRRETAAARESTRVLLQTADSPEARRILEGNLRAQDKTEQAAAQYLAYIHGQQRQLHEGRERLVRRYSVVENTYRTVSIAADLVELVRTSFEDLNALNEMALPELLPFGDLESQQRIEALTRKIKGEGT